MRGSGGGGGWGGGGGGGVGGGTVLTLPFEIDLRRNELSKCELPI